MKTLKQFKHNHRHLLIAAIFGAAAFPCIFGIEPLRYTGINWTLRGYDNTDITQHQTGWMFYRNSPWTFPLGIAVNLGYPEGTSTSYTDSIPVVSLLFKILSPILPEKFQFFGIYTCFCFVMQGFFSAALIYHFTKEKFYSSIGSIIFIFSSSFLERCFRHTALSSHWLLLAGLFIYFKGKDTFPFPKQNRLWCILLSVSLGVHPYLFAMNYALFIFSLWTTLTKYRNTEKTVSSFVICNTTIFIFGYIIGFFGNKIEPDSGFGTYSLNLNALINPNSMYHTIWSHFLRSRPTYGNQSEGIYYLGLPVFLTLLFTLLFFVIKSRNQFSNAVHSYTQLIFLMILFTVFAISNIVTFDDKVLFSLPMPAKLYNVLNIFRASGRFFLLPYYCIILIAVTSLYKLLENNRKLLIILCIILSVSQIIDIYPGIQDLHHFFETRETNIQYSDEWQDVAKKNNTAIVFDPIADRYLAFWLAQHNFSTNMMISAEIHRNAYWEKTKTDRERIRAGLETGSLNLDPKTIYIMENFSNNIKTKYAGQADLISIGYVKDDIPMNYWVLCPHHDLSQIDK